ncbi:hypothetical protein SKAU_G00123890 [Synaphobranchus kaupii]|uniref:Uncharacterized protein n=1 Tax=Synaphobranchus kaupii TaxID=118154 RepID=A0A9Q1J2P6_SYNKA|nr:hypothetical protein SKAU_G00123890 [Synaphobranchus kaupii]
MKSQAANGDRWANPTQRFHFSKNNGSFLSPLVSSGAREVVATGGFGSAASPAAGPGETRRLNMRGEWEYAEPSARPLTRDSCWLDGLLPHDRAARPSERVGAVGGQLLTPLYPGPKRGPVPGPGGSGGRRGNGHRDHLPCGAAPGVRITTRRNSSSATLASLGKATGGVSGQAAVASAGLKRFTTL